MTYKVEIEEREPGEPLTALPLTDVIHVCSSNDINEDEDMIALRSLVVCAHCHHTMHLMDQSLNPAISVDTKSVKFYLICDNGHGQAFHAGIDHDSGNMIVEVSTTINEDKTATSGA